MLRWFPRADGDTGAGVNHRGGRVASADAGAPAHLHGGCSGQAEAAAIRRPRCRRQRCRLAGPGRNRRPATRHHDWHQRRQSISIDSIRHRSKSGTRRPGAAGAAARPLVRRAACRRGGAQAARGDAPSAHDLRTFVAASVERRHPKTGAQAGDRRDRCLGTMCAARDGMSIALIVAIAWWLLIPTMPRPRAWRPSAPVVVVF